MPAHPLAPIEKIDPELFARIGRTREFVYADGALPAKVKYLIALALDAAHGAADGVASLARMAKEHGATMEEIAETIRVTNYIAGVGAVYTAARGLAAL
ncbi:MAG TPA: carboxymuconolactone decarboxylase family protein [Spirochaetia bacterium]|nr:carboxymuconolactone decarboxylase family protein [Spirochaetia bacterium]